MQNKLEIAIYNRLKNGDYIAAELKPVSEQRRRWIAIYKPKGKSVQENIPDHVFSVLDFELDKKMIDEYFGDEDTINQKRYYANTEEELFDILDSMGINLKTFTYPWKCDYPL